MKIAWAILILLAAAATSWKMLGNMEKKPIEGYQKQELAVWEWRPVRELDAIQLARTAKTEGITTIYINVNEYTDIREIDDEELRLKKLAEYMDNLAHLAKTLHDYNIQIEALGGNSNWGNDSHWYLADMVLDLARDFNKLHPETPLAGVQYDIEPYGQTDWEKNKSEYIKMFYLLIERLEKRRQQELPGLKFGLAVPAWYATNKIGGKTIMLEIARRMDGGNNYLAVMAYRNKAGGKGGAIDFARPSLEIAKSHGIKVIVGQETGKATPSYITFYGMKKAGLLEAIKEIKAEFGSEPAFAGIAINNLQTYQQLSQ